MSKDQDKKDDENLTRNKLKGDGKILEPSAFEKIKFLFNKLCASPKKMDVFLASDIKTAITFISHLPEVHDLIKLGPVSTSLLMWEFSKDGLDKAYYKTYLEKDAVLSCIAYIIDKTNFIDSTPVLLEFLRKNWLEEGRYFYSLSIASNVARRLNEIKLRELSSWLEEIIYTIVALDKKLGSSIPKNV